MLANKKYKTCEEYELLVNDQLEGIISINDEAELENHLADCQGCRDYKIETAKLLIKINALPKDIRPRNYLWNKIEQKITGETSENVYSLNNESQIKVQQSYRPFKWKYMISGIAAAIVLFGIIFLFAKYAGKTGTDTIDNNNLVMNVGAFWKVNSLNGNADIDGKQITKSDSMSVGQIITTNDTSRVELIVAHIGKVIVEPKSKVQLVKSSEGEYRIKVLYGTIDANIAAAPRTFFVDMPSVTAVDMGCSYKLSVDQSGDGLLFVKQGKVSLESNNRESMVTAGKFCITKKDVGPGTPFRGDTSPKLKQALIDFDFGNCAGNCVNTILKNSTRNDAVTLLNIIPRVDDDTKKIIYTRVAAFGNAPRIVPDDSIKYLDIEKLDVWMDKCQEEFEKNMEKHLNKMQFHLQKIPFSPEDEKHWEEYGKKWEKWGEEFGKDWEKWGEQYGKDMEKKFKFYKTPKDGSLYKFEFDGDSVHLSPMEREELKRDIEERKKDMEEMKRDMEEMQKEMKKEFDNDGLKREMEQMKEELKRSQEELKESMKELKRNLKNNIKVEIDSTGNYYKYKIETKDGNGEINTEENEVPKIPENKEDEKK